MDATALLYNPVVLAIAALAILLLIVLVLRAAHRRATPPPYMRRPAVLAAPERALLAALREAVGEQAVVLVKVPLRNALAPRRTLRRGQQRKALAALGERRFDFLLCAPDDTRPLVAIMLTRDTDRKRKKARQFVDDICAAAGLGLLHLDPEEQHSA
ncbi:MAG: DUF2726 domain-containing protein, partial [Halofilum sp. (in: g-proteobacteria)]